MIEDKNNPEYTNRPHPYPENQVPIDNDKGAGVEETLKDKMAQMVIDQRNKYRRIFRLRYRELILNVRDYINIPVSFNKYVIEWWLRNGYQVAVGKVNGYIQFLGYVSNTYTAMNPDSNFSTIRLTGKDINWQIPKEYIPTEPQFFKEITSFDNASTGDFVVLRNKPNSFISDYKVIDYYSDRIAELMASRYSLILQSKVTTVFGVDNGNSEDADNIVSMIYNGQPYVTLNDKYDLEASAQTIGDASIPERIKTLKQAFNDEQNELNNYLGINSTGIDKASGVSDSEVSSNDDYVVSTSNMYVRGVSEGLDLLNQRYNKQYQCFMNQPNVVNMQATADSKEDEK